MRFMIIVKGTKDTEAGVMPEEKLLVEMASYHEELAKAGLLLDGSGLKPTSKGARIRFSGGKRTWIDGPFTESKEVIAGYTLIQAKSREEAIQWAKRFPNPAGEGKDAEIEIRELFELEDFQPGETIERFREIGIGGQK
ncbi:MAG TPA: YciI family protein [Steroidobacteraceae bacterium]|nr:YciI family protein [Steroidobacteraceae bacterium]